MKKIFALLVVLIGFTYSYAQAPPGNGGKQLNAGVGLSGFGVPIYFGLDFGVHQDITIGPEFSFRSYYDAPYTHSIFVLGFNGNYHFNTLLDISSEWNLYAGLTLGYYVWSSPDDYTGSFGSGIGLDGQIGGRYFFSEKFGLNLEFGGGTITGGKFGITYKF